ncbi:unnamed protein product [Spirodela intermedia]|uniref:Uncharacterized protein n=1 Tax=Spirodela intermedia TaxID=51605 RepID=A0A7I8JQW8_SPIIN|nr:unnamed protein product [Spirodela intermedia]CAA6672536.1 unnamed protein product [Spirodela intermedia]
MILHNRTSGNHHCNTGGSTRL